LAPEGRREGFVEKLKAKEIKVNGLAGTVLLSRNEYGVPFIQANDFIDMFYGLGWIHAFDRPMELELARLVSQGTAAEHLEASEELIAADIYMRATTWQAMAPSRPPVSPKMRRMCRILLCRDKPRARARTQTLGIQADRA